MAFLNRVGSLIKCNVGKHLTSSVSSASSPSLFQAIRGMCSYPNTRIFVGGLAWATDTPSLREAFSHYGEVVDVKIIEDRETGRSRGFGFVTFASSEAASAAIQALDGQELQGRAIKVNFATEKPRGGYGGGGGGGYGGGGGGYGGGYSGGNEGGGNYSRVNQYSRQGDDDLGYGGGNQYSGGGSGGGYGGGNQYSGGGSGGGYGGADSVQGGGGNFGSLLNDDTSGAVGGKDDFGQDKDEVGYANRN